MHDLVAKLSCCPIVISILRRKERNLSLPKAQGLFSHANQAPRAWLALNTPSIILKAVSIRAGGPVVKGVLVGFGIMLILALIPVVHFVGIPFGPFIGGYFGITAAGGYSPTPAKRALVFGGLLGSIVLLTTATAATVLTLLTDLNALWLWAPVAGFTFYTSSMGALGAMYSQLRTAH